MIYSLLVIILIIVIFVAWIQDSFNTELMEKIESIEKELIKLNKDS